MKRTPLKQRGSLTPTRPKNIVHLPLSLKSEGPILENLSPKNISKRNKDKACMMLALSIMGIWISCLGGFNFNSGKFGAKNVLMEAIQVETQVQVGQVVDYYNAEGELVSSISIQIHLEDSQAKGVSDEITVNSAGPHAVTAYDMISDDRPHSPTLRIIGDAILPIPLIWDSSGQWKAWFSLPSVDGKYQLEAQWFGCSHTCEPKYSNTISFQVKGSEKWTSELVPILSSGAPTWSDSATLFPTQSRWISKDQIKSFPGLPEEAESKPRTMQQYAWAQVGGRSSKQENEKWKWIAATSRGVSNETASMVNLASMIEASTQQAWFDRFRDLSNYELVCWIGGKAAELVHANFRSMRNELFPGQRPFKFHYYPMTNLEKPDETWDQETKEKFRKCKHILVVIDDDSFMEHRDGKPLSSHKYKKRVTTFLKHLVRAFPDPTFPIWMFTIALEAPHRAKYETKHCYRDTSLGYGSNAKVHNLQHPCNGVLFDIFRKKATLFAPKHAARVRLLDNTDLSMPGLFGAPSLHDNHKSQGKQENSFVNNLLHPRQQDILALIALRIYIIVGKQVQEWRSIGQIGLVDGLHHNDTIEPNFDLKPYKWN